MRHLSLAALAALLPRPVALGRMRISAASTAECITALDTSSPCAFAHEPSNFRAVSKVPETGCSASIAQVRKMGRSARAGRGSDAVPASCKGDIVKVCVHAANDLGTGGLPFR